MKPLILNRSSGAVAVPAIGPVLPNLKAATGEGHPKGMDQHLYMKVRSQILGQPDLAAQVRSEAAPGLLPVGAQGVGSAVVRAIVSAGRAAASVDTLHGRVLQALLAGAPVLQVYGHPQRAAAAELAWADREAIYSRWQQLRKGASVRDAVLWCMTLPGIGQVTATHLAKDLGWDAVSPDPLLCRLAGIHHRDRLPPTGRMDRCQLLVERLARASGDPVRLVEAVLLAADRAGVLLCNLDGTRISVQALPPVEA